MSRVKQDPLQSSYLKYKICVSGAADTTFCPIDAPDKAKEIGKEIVRHDGVVVTGATTGVPYWAAIGAKEAGGISIGISPAASERAHVNTYNLPTDYFDLIIYTGFEYSGRNLLLMRSSDAIIFVCGRIGTLNEFTIAFEDQKPLGVLSGSGGVADEIKELIDKSHRPYHKIVYDSDPKRLIEKLIELIDKEKVVPVAKKFRSAKTAKSGSKG